MRKSYSLVEAPATEPVELSDVKTFLRVDGTAEDSLITSLIKSARLMAESYTHRVFITQTWKLTLDSFPNGVERFVEGVLDAPRFNGSEPIELSRLPVQEITHIKTYDDANAVSTVPSATYLLSEGRVILNDGYTWPTSLREYGAIEITHVSGYGDADDVPEDIKQAIRLIVRAMYDSCDCTSVPLAAKGLLDPYRLSSSLGAW